MCAGVGYGAIIDRSGFRHFGTGCAWRLIGALGCGVVGRGGAGRALPMLGLVAFLQWRADRPNPLKDLIFIQEVVQVSTVPPSVVVATPGIVEAELPAVLGLARRNACDLVGSPGVSADRRHHAVSADVQLLPEPLTVRRTVWSVP